MTKMKSWQMSCAALMFSVACVIAAQAQTFETILDFNGSDGEAPYLMSLAQGNDGSLFGTTLRGGNYEGELFKISPADALELLHGFHGTEGSYPYSSLVLASDGSMYGTTSSGGENDNGTVFKITEVGALTMLYSFCAVSGCADGASPYGSLIQAANGDFYGTTYAGGANNGGTVFEMNSEGTLHSLVSLAAMSGPYAGLVQATDGNFYGTTGNGTLIKVTPEGILTALAYLSGDSTGQLILGTNGNLYGTTIDCPIGNCGTIFEATLDGKVTTLYKFCPVRNDCTDGANPYAGVIQATDGNLYGTTYAGGDLTCDPPNGCGTVFRLTPDHKFTTLHQFHGPDGLGPYGGLVQATDGNLYGSTFSGGKYYQGTIFAIDLGLPSFVRLVQNLGKVGQKGGIIGRGLSGTTGVSINGIAVKFAVMSDTFIQATVPAGATTGYVMVTTPAGVLKSNVPFHVIR